MRDEAMKYIPKVKDLRHKVDYYLGLMKFKEAIEAAAGERDIDMLVYIKNRSKNSKTQETIDGVIAKLS